GRTPDWSSPPGAARPAPPGQGPPCSRGRPLSVRATPWPVARRWRRCPVRVPTMSCIVAGRSYRVGDSAARPLPTPVLVEALAAAGMVDLAHGALTLHAELFAAYSLYPAASKAQPPCDVRCPM